MTTTTTTWSTNFVVPSTKKYGDPSFNLINPVSDNSGGAFTYTINNTNIATTNGNTVTILGAGTTSITATQAAYGIYTSKTVTVSFTVSVIPSTLTNFIIPKKEFNDISFNLTDPSSNSIGSFTYVSNNTNVATISGRVVTIHAIGTTIIYATQETYGNYGSTTISTEFTVGSSIVRAGVQNQLDLSWNTPLDNGTTIKNYFFYSEERTTSDMASTIESSSYDSYLKPVPYSAPFLSSTGVQTGFDVNVEKTTVTLLPSVSNSTTNYFDLSYNAEVELSWKYHQDNPIVDVCANSFSQTIMTLSLNKRNTVVSTSRVDLLLNYERTYDSFTNGLGVIPQNNGKIMKDIFSITFDNIDIVKQRDLLYFKKDDIIEGSIKFSNLFYYPATATALTDAYKKFYSIIVLGVRVAPYRFPIVQDFSGAVVSAIGSGGSGGSTDRSVHYLRKMTRPLTNFNELKIDLSWNYIVDISNAQTLLSPFPITSFNAPFQLRVQCYSRSFKTIYSGITDASYNTSSVGGFLSTVSDPNYNTYLLFDISRNYIASYENIIIDPSTNTLPVISDTFDVSGALSFPLSSTINDPAHTQIVYVFSLVVTDPTYIAVFQTNPFKLNMLSHTLTPRQLYRFSAPDPTIASSNILTSPTKTIYNINTPYYQDSTPFYRFYNLTNGNYYSYKIAANNMVGTGAFSQLYTKRCGSVPNIIVNVPPGTSKYYFSESERLSNKISVLWSKPEFSGYEILNFIIQINVDISGRWVNNLEYTQDLSLNTVTFDAFNDLYLPVSEHVKDEPNNYRYDITNVSYRTLALAQSYTQRTGIPAQQYGSLINGNKYYLRVSSANELGIATYSSILTGIPITRPDNSPAAIIGNKTVIGNNLVYLTWKIPPNDGGAPILNYIIDYQEIDKITGKLVGKVYRYNQNAVEPVRSTYPKDELVAVYNSLKNRYTMSAAELSALDASKNELTKYIIPPSPITLLDPDIINLPTDPSKNVVLNYVNRTFTYTSSELTQNVFDISNIQLKWYYFNVNIVENQTVTFKMSIRGHLTHVSDPSLNIYDIFYVPADTLHTVTTARLSVEGSYKYIDYKTDSVIGDGATPKIFVPTLPRIDSYKESKRYKLTVVFTITSILPEITNNKFILYSGKIVINGSSPVRTDASMNTTFTMKLLQNALSPLNNDKTYRFTITPFNIADYFPTYTLNTTDIEMGITNASPITIPSYSLVQESGGGKVILLWKYTSKSSYYVTIRIPTDYADSDYPEEYPSIQQDDEDKTSLSILTPNLSPDTNFNVTYSIPSVESDDILRGNAQHYLRPGRAYNITISAVKIAEVDGIAKNLVAPSVLINSSGTYIVPFMAPLRPTSLFAVGYKDYISLSWKLPSLVNDPNYYITDIVSSYYTYRYYSLEMRDTVGGGGVGGGAWTVVSNQPIEIPAGASEGYIMTRDVSNGIINERNFQFRVRILIQNGYNSQIAYSNYTYITKVNNDAIVENENNTIYPSQYPYKPSGVTFLYASRPEPRTLSVEFNQPSYSGNATKYECYIEYYRVVSSEWVEIFDFVKGIADTSSNLLILSSIDKKLEINTSIGALTNFRISCKDLVLSYAIRVRLLGKITGVTEPYPNPTLSYTDYSSVSTISI